MGTFDIRSPETQLRRPIVLEASAGTGKTFAIEHAVCRYLIESPPIPHDRILVMTFTKEATRELKHRIRRNIEKAIYELESGEIETPYLRNVNPEGAIRRLKCALFGFHEMAISTLHGFCSGFLQDLGKFSGGEESLLSGEEIRRVVRDTLRLEIHKPDYSVAQLQRLFNDHRNEYKRLENEIVKRVSEGFFYLPVPCYKESLEQALHFRQTSPVTTPQIETWFQQFQKIGGVEQLLAFWDTPDENSFEALIRSNSLDKSKKLRKKGNPDENVETSLFPLKHILYEASSPQAILSRILNACRTRLEAYTDQKNRPGHFDLLRQVEKWARDGHYISAFDVVIVDEFQDTDPLQWKILRHLFSKTQMMIVGDPKQSIYAFRQADIYTYLHASQTLTGGKRDILGTNYRSVPALVEAVNILFSVENLFQLPRTQSTLSFHPAKAAQIASEGTAPFHFWKGGRLLEGIVGTIQNENRPLSDYAILVATHKEAFETSQFLAKYGIHTQLLKAELLPEEGAPLKRLLKAIERPFSIGALHAALGKIPSEEEVQQFHVWHHTWKEQGFGPLFQPLRQRLGVSAEPFLERILEKRSTPREAIEFLATFQGEERRQNPDANAVKILTLHASKGLEFSVVFALGVTSGRSVKKGDFLPVPAVDRILLAPLDPQNPLYAQAVAEMEAEKIRQLYVALTRAKEMLYVPFNPEPHSPLALLVSHHPTFEKLLNQHTNLFAIEEPPHAQQKPFVVVTPSISQETFIPQFPRRDLKWMSYSTLAQSKGILIEGSPHDFHVDLQTIHTLPAGAETGLLLHYLLEVLPFDQTPTIEWLNPYLLSNRFLNWEYVILQLLKQVLEAPLGPLRLKQATASFREHPFFYTGSQWIKGVIDLVVEVQGRLYIIDWKSDWLGPDVSSYSHDALAAAMEQHDYHLQATLYKEALLKYCQLVDKPYGAILHVFLRGLETGGVYVTH